jgi:hypothetical protein
VQDEPQVCSPELDGLLSELPTVARDGLPAGSAQARDVVPNDLPARRVSFRVLLRDVPVQVQGVLPDDSLAVRMQVRALAPDGSRAVRASVRAVFPAWLPERVEFRGVAPGGSQLLGSAPDAPDSGFVPAWGPGRGGRWSAGEELQGLRDVHD